MDYKVINWQGCINGHHGGGIITLIEGVIDGYHGGYIINGWISDDRGGILIEVIKLVSIL